VVKFKYVGTTVTNQNYIQEEIRQAMLVALQFSLLPENVKDKT
jgi:hypothetical protein